MQPFEYPSVRYWSKEINVTRTGGAKKIFFLIRDIDDAAMASASVGILSIRGPEVCPGVALGQSIHG